MRDDGASLDGAADDAIYGLEYVALIPGAYHVVLKASGVGNDGRPFARYLSTAFVVPGKRKRPVQVGEGLPPRDQGEGACGCEAKVRATLTGYAGVTIPHGALAAVADPSYSLGLKPALNVAVPLPGRWSVGLYLGYDRFMNPTASADFELKHVSPELEWQPVTRFCPAPAVHGGVGAYLDENDDSEYGWNIGASLGLCIGDRIKALLRYDYRYVGGFVRDYSTLQGGVRLMF